MTRTFITIDDNKEFMIPLNSYKKLVIGQSLTFNWKDSSGMNHMDSGTVTSIEEREIS